MNIVKTTWKAFVKENEPTAEDMAAYHILRAVVSKSNDKFAVAKALIDRAFTPISNNTKLANGAAPYYGAYLAIRYAKGSVFYRLVEEKLTDLEKISYSEIYHQLYTEFHNGFEKHEPEYMFFFVRQDISPEQQLVQTAHVALVAGKHFLNDIHPHFVVIGVQNEAELENIVEELKFKIDYTIFKEEDLGNSMTAIATRPIKRHKKGFLSKYKTLKFAK